jgi:nitrogen regulatory protein P-II 2
MTPEQMDLVTIIAEHVLREPLLADLRRLGARGYTLGEVEGEGTRGTHAADWQGKNLRIEVVATRAVSDRVLAHLAEVYFTNYSLIAYRTEISVMRAGKFR